MAEKLHSAAPAGSHVRLGGKRCLPLQSLLQFLSLSARFVKSVIDEIPRPVALDCMAMQWIWRVVLHSEIPACSESTPLGLVARASTRTNVRACSRVGRHARAIEAA